MWNKNQVCFKCLSYLTLLMKSNLRNMVFHKHSSRLHLYSIVSHCSSWIGFDTKIHLTSKFCVIDKTIQTIEVKKQGCHCPPFMPALRISSRMLHRRYILCISPYIKYNEAYISDHKVLNNHTSSHKSVKPIFLKCGAKWGVLGELLSKK